jgi:hypothetical protein
VLFLQLRLLQRDFFQHFQSNLASSDFSQSRYGRFVLAFYLGCMPLAEHARPVSGGKYQLKAIGNLLQAVFYSNTSHESLQKNQGVHSGYVQCGKRLSSGAALRRKFETLRVNDCFEVKKRTVKKFVDYNEVKFTDLRDLNRCVFHP